MYPTFLLYVPPLVSLIVAFVQTSVYNRRLGILGIDGTEIWSDRGKMIRCAIYAVPLVVLTVSYWWIMTTYDPSFIVAGTMAGFLFGTAIWHILYYSLEIRPMILIDNLNHKPD